MKNKFQCGQKVYVSGDSIMEGEIGIITEVPDLTDLYEVTFDDNTTSHFFEDEIEFEETPSI